MKICLIGSTRFMWKYRLVNQELTLAGHIVYTVAAISSSVADEHTDDQEITPAQKETLDLVHLRKILESDAIYLVTDESGYFGESTSREIKWAGILGKKFLRDLPRPIVEYATYSG